MNDKVSLLIIVLLSTLFALELKAQDEEMDEVEFNFSGFVDTYFSYDFNQPLAGTSKQPFLFHFNRHNEFNVNLALISMNVKHDKYRANLGLQGGTYAVDNYAAESAAMRAIYEANVGVALNAEGTVWIDAGIFPSHLGFASIQSIDNYTLTRSLVAESSPYFLSGAKISYEGESLLASLIFTNGWQRISRVIGNNTLSVGTQLAYSSSSGWVANWSTFIGTDDSDVDRRMRIFNNLYADIPLGDHINVLAGLDFGMQQVAPSQSTYDTWFGITGIMQYRIDEKTATALRVEYYGDEQEVIVGSPSPDGFKVNGLSLNIDYKPAENVALRAEGRMFSASDQIFSDNAGNFTSNNFALTLGLAAKLFDK